MDKVEVAVLVEEEAEEKAMAKREIDEQGEFSLNFLRSECD